MELDAIAEHLLSDLRQVLHCAADLNFYREEVTAASGQVAARQSEAALRKEITEESSVFH